MAKVEVVAFNVIYTGSVVPVYACLFALRSFWNEDGDLVTAGDPSKMSGGWIRRKTVTVVGNTVTVPAFSGSDMIDWTVDNATGHSESEYLLGLYSSSGKRLEILFTDIKVPELPSITQWEALAIYSSNGAQPQRHEYYDKLEVNRLIDLRQIHDTDLDQIAGLVPANDDFIQRKAGVWTNRTPAQVAADLPSVTETLLRNVTELDALITLANANPTEFYDGIVIAGLTITAPKTIPANMALRFVNGSKLIKGTDGGITFQGPGVRDTTSQIFSGFAASNEPVRVTYGFATVDTTDINLATDTFHKVAHGFPTGRKMWFTAGTFEIAGVPVTFGINYWIINVDADNFQLASSYANAQAAIPLNITAQGATNSVQYAVTDIDTTTETFYCPSHAFTSAQRIKFASGTFNVGANPIDISTLYFVIVVDADNFRIATSRANALAGTPADITYPGYTDAVAVPEVDVVWTGGYPTFFRPEWWNGNVGDGSTNSIPAFDSMFQAMQSFNASTPSYYRGGHVRLGSGKMYRCESPLRIRRPVLIEGGGLGQSSPNTLLYFPAGVKGVTIDGSSTFDRVVGKQSGAQTEIRGVNLQGTWGPNNTIVSTDGTHILLTGGDIQQFSPFGDEVNGEYTVAAAPYGTTITINGYDYILQPPVVQAQTVATAVDTVTNLITVNNEYETGLKVYVSPTANLPAPLVENTPYYVIKNYADTGKIGLASSLANAVAGTKIDLTTTGSSFYITPQPGDVNAMSSCNIQKPRLMVAVTGGINQVTPIGSVSFPSNHEWEGQTLTFYSPEETLSGTCTIISHTSSVMICTAVPQTGAWEVEVSGINVQTGQAARLNVNHGIEFRTSAKITDMSIYGFSGSGVMVNSQVNPTGRNGDEPNGNNSWIEKVVSQQNRGNGFTFYGSNSNNISTFEVDGTTNFGYGMFEIGTSGSNHWGFHMSFNTYGAVNMQGAVAANMIVACYTEGQQPHSRFGGRGAVILGGNHGAGIGDAIAIAGANPHYLQRGISISNTKAWSIGLGSIYNNQSKVMMAFGAAEEWANTSQGGFATLAPINMAYSLQYDWPRLAYYGLSTYDHVAGEFRTPWAITGSESDLGSGQMILPDGFRTGDGVEPLPTLDPKIHRMIRGTVTINPADIPASGVDTQTFTLTGAVVGDNLILNVPAAGLTAGLVVLQVTVSAADTISITFLNSTGAAINEGSASWSYLLIR